MVRPRKAAIGFSAVFVWEECTPSGATQGPIQLEGKICAGKATSFPGHRGGRTHDMRNELAELKRLDIRYSSG